MMAVDLVVRGASTLGGAVLGAAARTAGALRPAAKPLHPKGRVLVGRLRRRGLTPSTGIRFLDEIADEEVIVRESRAVGLPRPLPDIHGLAIRVPLPDQAFGDLLLASTGYGRLSRYVLTPSRETYGRPMTTLLPYRTDAGPVLLGAHSESPGVVTLACSVRGGSWRPFAVLTISTCEAPDLVLSFDPVLHEVPGLAQYPAVRRLREPAYRSARRSRSDR